MTYGIKLCIGVTVRDFFGVFGIQVKIDGLEKQCVYTNNLTNVSVEFKWKVRGWDNIKKTIWEGFKINITAMDRNRNFGFKEEEQPGIAKLVVSAILGALLAMVKFIAELVSGIFNFIYDLAKSLIGNIVKIIKKGINDLMTSIENSLFDIISPFKSIIDGEDSKSSIIDTAEITLKIISCFVLLIINPFTIGLAIIETIVKIVEGIYKVASSIIAGVGPVFDLIVTNLANLLFAVLVGCIVGSIIDHLMREEWLQAAFDFIGLPIPVALLIIGIFSSVNGIAGKVLAWDAGASAVISPGKTRALKALRYSTWGPSVLVLVSLFLFIMSTILATKFASWMGVDETGILVIKYIITDFRQGFKSHN